MGLLSPEAKAALEAPVINVATLVELDFSYGVERWWNGDYVLNYEGEEWKPSYNAGRISDMTSSKELRANGITLNLGVPFDPETNIPLGTFRNIRPADYKNRRASVRLAFFDDEFQNVIYTHDVNYRMDTINYNVSAKKGAVISIMCESELMQAGKRQVRRLTNAQQQTDHPGDLGLQFSAFIASGREISWGSGGAFFR